MKPVVHAKNIKIADDGHTTECGLRGKRPKSSWNHSQVTCEKCLQKLYPEEGNNDNTGERNSGR